MVTISCGPSINLGWLPRVACIWLFSVIFALPASAITIKIENCDLAQAAPVLQAHYLAGNAASEAASTLARNGVTPLVRKWFGALDTNQLNYVRQTYLNIANAASNGATKHACVGINPTQCQSELAYLFPTAPEITSHYCPSFHPLGDQAKARIVIHELSHANAIRGTDDACYGSQCLRLATTNPERTIRAADPYAWFVAEMLGWNPD